MDDALEIAHRQSYRRIFQQRMPSFVKGDIEPVREHRHYSHRPVPLTPDCVAGRSRRYGAGG